MNDAAKPRKLEPQKQVLRSAQDFGSRAQTPAERLTTRLITLATNRISKRSGATGKEAASPVWRRAARNRCSTELKTRRSLSGLERSDRNNSHLRVRKVVFTIFI
jgi:hypothetical protein